MKIFYKTYTPLIFVFILTQESIDAGSTLWPGRLCALPGGESAPPWPWHSPDRQGQQRRAVLLIGMTTDCMTSVLQFFFTGIDYSILKTHRYYHLSPCKVMHGKRRDYSTVDLARIGHHQTQHLLLLLLLLPQPLLFIRCWMYLSFNNLALWLFSLTLLLMLLLSLSFSFIKYLRSVHCIRRVVLESIKH